METLAGVFRGTPPGRRRVRAGEVARQRGHDGDAEDGEGSGDDEGSQVVARDVFEEPWRGAGRLSAVAPTPGLERGSKICRQVCLHYANYCATSSAGQLWTEG